MLKIGLTGGIACGKSTACNILKDLGPPVIEADKISRDLLQPDTLFAKQVKKKHGNLDRAELKTRITQDPEFREWLENLLHPEINKIILNKINQLPPETQLVIIDIPLLIETGPYPYLDKILVIDCPAHLQIERLMQRDKITKLEALALLQLQASREERLKIADYVVSNDQDKAALKGLLKNILF